MAKSKDWTGQKFGMLTFKNKTNKKYGNHYLWEAVCDCGVLKLVVPSHVVRVNGIKSCGCLFGPKDWTGQKFGRFTFVKRSDKKQGGAYFWEALCECGTTKLIVPASVVLGGTVSCGCYHKDIMTFGKVRKYDPVISTARIVWCRKYKDGDLAFEEFLELSQLPCFYCGVMFSNKYKVSGKNTSEYQTKNGDFVYNGLDRVDNSQLHNKNNVVPCCKRCNSAKLDYSQEEFANMITMIYKKHLETKKDSK
jgi:hypothetical protein